MKKTIATIAIAGLASSAAASLSVGGTADVAGGADGADTSAAFVYLDTTVSLPSILSIDSIDLQLSHDFASDVHVQLVAPNGDSFAVVLGQGSSATPIADQYAAFGPFDAGFDSTEIGTSVDDFGLDFVQDYSFAAAGGEWLDAAFGVAQPAGTYAADEFPSMGYAAGDWRLVVLDVFATADAGALGDWAINYTIPAPGAMGLVGVAGLAAARRRR